MPSYGYIAFDRSGKRVKDNIEASSEEAAKNSLRAAGYSAQQVLDSLYAALANNGIWQV